MMDSLPSTLFQMRMIKKFKILITDDFYVTFMGSIATDDLDKYTSTLLVTNVFPNGTILT